jgi:hypothetical protein
MCSVILTTSFIGAEEWKAALLTFSKFFMTFVLFLRIVFDSIFVVDLF